MAVAGVLDPIPLNPLSKWLAERGINLGVQTPLDLAGPTIVATAPVAATAKTGRGFLRGVADWLGEQQRRLKQAIRPKENPLGPPKPPRSSEPPGKRAPHGGPAAGGSSSAATAATAGAALGLTADQLLEYLKGPGGQLAPTAAPVVVPVPVAPSGRYSSSAARENRRQQRATAKLARDLEREVTLRQLISETGALARQGVASAGAALTAASSHPIGATAVSAVALGYLIELHKKPETPGVLDWLMRSQLAPNLVHPATTPPATPVVAPTPAPSSTPAPSWSPAPSSWSPAEPAPWSNVPERPIIGTGGSMLAGVAANSLATALFEAALRPGYLNAYLNVLPQWPSNAIVAENHVRAQVAAALARIPSHAKV